MFQTHKPIYLILAILAAIGIAAGLLFTIQNFKIEEEVASIVPSPKHQGEIEKPSVDDVASWQTYRNQELGFSVQYPPGWIEPSREEGDVSFAVGYRENRQSVYWVTSGYISADQYNRMGVSYCSANSTDTSRCENIEIGGALVQIDWGLPESKPEQESQSKAVAWVFDAKGGVVVLNLQPVTARSRVRFNEILSTFKFTKSSSLLQVCPDEWYQNDMPIVSGTPESRQYYVLDGQRRELAEFDSEWVKTNCKINKQIVE